jgi:hypothetical protein
MSCNIYSTSVHVWHLYQFNGYKHFFTFHFQGILSDRVLNVSSRCVRIVVAERLFLILGENRAERTFISVISNNADDKIVS